MLLILIWLIINLLWFQPAAWIRGANNIRAWEYLDVVCGYIFFISYTRTHAERCRPLRLLHTVLKTWHRCCTYFGFQVSSRRKTIIRIRRGGATCQSGWVCVHPGPSPIDLHHIFQHNNLPNFTVLPDVPISAERS